MKELRRQMTCTSATWTSSLSTKYLNEWKYCTCTRNSQKIHRVVSCIAFGGGGCRFCHKNMVTLGEGAFHKVFNFSFLWILGTVEKYRLILQMHCLKVTSSMLWLGYRSCDHQSPAAREPSHGRSPNSLQSEASDFAKVQLQQNQLHR